MFGDAAIVIIQLISACSNVDAEIIHKADGKIVLFG